jgi:hypothetical protein
MRWAKGEWLVKKVDEPEKADEPNRVCLCVLGQVPLRGDETVQTALEY